MNNISSNNLKVAIVCLSHYQGGMELDSIRNTQIFLRNNINSILICKKNSFIEKKAIELNIPFHSIDFSRKLSIKLIVQLRSILKSEQVTSLIFFGASEIKSIYFSVRNLDCNVIIRHGTTKSSPKKDLLHRLFYSCVKYHVAISEHLHRNVLEIIPCTKNQVKTIYNISQDDHVERKSPKEMAFLHVGRVEEGKGVFDAVKSLGKANIPRQYKKITFVGTYTDSIQKELITLSHNYSVDIFFEGFVKDVKPFYMKHIFFLFPSYGEGLGNVILEALKYGLICITYNNTVFNEFTNNLEFRYFYTAENKNIDSLAKAIELAIIDSDKIKDNSNPHYLNYNKYFSESVFIEKWKSILS